MTGLEVFNLALALMGEIPASGVANPSDVADYKAQTPSILSIGQLEIAEAENITPLPGVITDLNNKLVISDKSAMKILPYLLASHLLVEENPDMASFFNSKFEEMKRKIPATAVKITDIYNINGGE
jgi:hypothetical protein